MIILIGRMMSRRNIGDDDHDDDDDDEDDVLEASPLLSTKVNQNSNLASLGKYCCMTFPASFRCPFFYLVI